jgi:hypothetical protein
LVGLVREKIGPVAAFKDANGRGAPARRRAAARSCAPPCAKIADAEPYTVPPTIDDPAILDEITHRAERGDAVSIFKPSGTTWRLGKCDRANKHFQAKWNHLAARKMRFKQSVLVLQSHRGFRWS